MNYYSGGYVPFNPNFVIANLKDKPNADKKLSGIIDILKNILFRGVPSIPSIFLREYIGEPISGNLTYTFGTKKNEWNTVIKTGRNSAPALIIYDELCNKNPKIASLVLPECLFGQIVVSNTDAKECADFYIPSHKVEIEIDGRQHLKTV